MAKYLNFPIVLLDRIFTDKYGCLNFIIDFAIYKKALHDYDNVNTATLDYVADQLGIRLGNTLRSLQRCKSFLKGKIDPHDLGPYVGINKEIIFDYLKNDKTEFQIASFCAFCAVRSILGKKKYCKTNKGFIHARMFGYTSTKYYPNVLTDLQKKYLNRYHIDKVLQELELNWHLKLFGGHCRGFYVSFDLDHSSLALVHNRAKKKVKIDELKRKKSAARKYVIAEMKNTTSSATTEHKLYGIRSSGNTAS